MFTYLGPECPGSVVVSGGDDVDLWCKHVNVMDVGAYSPLHVVYKAV